MGWSVEHTNMAAIGVAVVSEAIALSPMKSNSIAQLVIGFLKALVGLRGTKSK